MSPAAVDLWQDLPVASAAYDLVAVGGDLAPEALIAAYRAGCFPWPPGGPTDAAVLRAQTTVMARRGLIRRLPGPERGLPWFSPDPRAVFLPERVHASRSLRRTLRRSGWTTTVDRAFADVVTACAERRQTWITRRIRQAYLDLHTAGHAHSVEVWSEDGALVGGLYGVLTGAVFSGESMFHRATDASKVALVELAARAVAGGIRLIDSQEPTEHLQRMGQVLMRRADYLAALESLRDEPATLPPDQLPVARLV